MFSYCNKCSRQKGTQTRVSVPKDPQRARGEQIHPFRVLYLPAFRFRGLLLQSRKPNAHSFLPNTTVLSTICLSRSKKVHLIHNESWTDHPRASSTQAVAPRITPSTPLLLPLRVVLRWILFSPVTSTLSGRWTVTRAPPRARAAGRPSAPPLRPLPTLRLPPHLLLPQPRPPTAPPTPLRC